MESVLPLSGRRGGLASLAAVNVTNLADTTNGQTARGRSAPDGTWADSPTGWHPGAVVIGR